MRLVGVHRPAKNFFELSLFYYDTKDAVFSGPPTYEAFDYTSVGGELTFNYMPNNLWELQGSIPIPKVRRKEKGKLTFLNRWLP